MYRGNPDEWITRMSRTLKITEETSRIGMSGLIAMVRSRRLHSMSPPSLPDGALGAQHLRDVFGRMGYSDQVSLDAVA